MPRDCHPDARGAATAEHAVLAPLRISSLADIRAIEREPYARFMPYHSTHAALAAAARRHGQRPALSYWHVPDPDVPATTWSYADLLADVHRAGHLFQSLAGSATPRVAMLLPAVPAAYVTLWGAESVGVVCPLNYLLQPDHLVELVQAAGCNILVALGPCPDLAIWSQAEVVRQRCPGLRAVVQVQADGARASGAARPPGVIDFWHALGQQPTAAPALSEPLAASTLAALFHTGGTTGTPKLAQHQHGNQLHAARGAAAMYGLTPTDSIINGFPLFHVAGSMVYGLSMLLSGARVYLPTVLGFRNAAFMRQYWAFVARERITLATAVPTGIATLMAAPWHPEQLESVRAMITGGSPLPDALADECEQRLGIPVRNTLGMTESAGVIAIEPIAAPRQRGSCGWPLPFTEVQVVDPQHGSVMAPGEVGVLRVRGPNISPGYTEASRNAGTFEDGWLSSGDLARQDDTGRYHVIGRSKDIIIRNSHNIDPQQIEDVLMAHPAVSLAAVVGQPDAYAGELPAAYLVMRAGVEPDLAAIRAHAEQHVAERPAWPKYYEIVDTLPQTAVGKVYKPELRRRAIERILGEHLEGAGLAGQVRVVCTDTGKGLDVVFALLPDVAGSAAVRAQVQAIMRPFALAFRIQCPEGSASAAGHGA